MSVPIEAARATDEAAVVALWSACGLTVPYNDPATDFRFARAGAASDVLVARAADGAVAGTVMVGHDGHRGWLYYLAAAPSRQGEGIGRLLVAAAERWLQARGIAKVQLLVRETNTQVVGFYRHLGFEVAPRTVMSKWLDGRD
ncbi:ribosomal protein S18 acetylase RimI-like enzyme [Ancylobacter sp. 3268]|uniref:GNAT family acetyltransferase n=1 Tax=Ancylobacter sp. 3268 TaxID=2817752 RepID=UPI002859CF8D|nr:GNAT family acetyltransferase [Ancylobacter sp. 3268]MDR6952893.1 ribosomal protein S18 acetylase RimI-like enzyme [Ancylobacter sp. 3268]